MTIGPVVQTRLGAVRGFEDESDTLCFKAIPFARPPVGELRWKAPRDPEPWQGVRSERAFSAPCIQRHFIEGTVVGSEDCLYLNIWRPRTGEKKLPVYFWVHGGGNFAQFPFHEECSGARVAGSSNLVFVSINYRLAELGWFTHPSLRTGRSRNELDDSGNYGTLDIIKALQWVRDNIEAFGGDTGTVLITGESAGAYDVLTLLLSPPARGLFHRAMAQSGRPGTLTVAEADAEADALVAQLLVNDGAAPDPDAAARHRDAMAPEELARYLRSKTYQELSACRQRRSVVFEAIEDGAVIPGGGFGAFDNGGYPNKVPVIIGTNKEEMKLFSFISNAFEGDDALYQIAADFVSDRKKATSCDGLLRRLRANPDQPDVYGYQFCWGAYAPDGRSPIAEPFALKLGAYHGLDISFFLGLDTNLGPLGELVFSEKNRRGRKALTRAMMAYLANFARTGDPNRPGQEPTRTRWEPWSNAPGGSRCVLFDVDGDEPGIAMSREEMTEQEIESRLAALDEPLRSKVREHLAAMASIGW